jgi:hypothetical protein
MALDTQLLQTKHIYTVSQLLAVDDLTGILTIDENRPLLDEFTASPQLQYKLRLLACSFRCVPVADKFVTQSTIASSLSPWIKTLSQVFKKQQQHLFHKMMQLPPSNVTRQQDGITLPPAIDFQGCL